MKSKVEKPIVATFYKVVEVDPYADTAKMTWQLAEVHAISVSTKQIKMRSCRYLGFNVVFKPEYALGRIFFKTKREALNHFIDQQAKTVKTAERHRIAALDAGHWAQTEREKLP